MTTEMTLPDLHVRAHASSLSKKQICTFYTKDIQRVPAVLAEGLHTAQIQRAPFHFDKFL